jgi:hypothetical protein
VPAPAIYTLACAPLALPRRLVRILRTMIARAMLAMCHTEPEVSLSGTGTLQFLRANHPWDIRTAFQELAQELLGRCFVPTPLPKDIQDGPLLIHGPPSGVPLAVHGQKDGVEGPCVP